MTGQNLEAEVTGKGAVCLLLKDWESFEKEQGRKELLDDGVSGREESLPGISKAGGNRERDQPLTLVPR